MRLGSTFEFTHVALGLIPEILNVIYVIVAVYEELRMVDTEVIEVRHIQHIIVAPLFAPWFRLRNAQSDGLVCADLNDSTLCVP